MAHVVRQSYERAAAGEHVGERLAALRDRPRETREPGPWPVVEADRLVGMLTVRELEEAGAAGRDSATLAELVDPPEGPVTAESFVHVHPDQSLDMALRRMGQSGLDVLPVVSRKNVRELVGVVTLADIPQAYGGEGADILAAQTAAEPRISPKAMLTTVVAGVLGLFLLGGFLTHHYYAQRLDTAAQFYATGPRSPGRAATRKPSNSFAPRCRSRTAIDTGWRSDWRSHAPAARPKRRCTWAKCSGPTLPTAPQTWRWRGWLGLGTTFTLRCTAYGGPRPGPGGRTIRRSGSTQPSSWWTCWRTAGISGRLSPSCCS